MNHQIASAPVGSPLRGLRPIEDPSDEIIEVHLSALKWNILQRRFGLVASDLAKLQQNSVELLELLKSNLQRRQEKSQVGTLKRLIAYCTKLAKFFSLDGQRTSAPRYSVEIHT